MICHIRLDRVFWSGLTVLATFAVQDARECRSQEWAEAHARGPDKGSLVICGGGILPEELRGKVAELAGGERAKIVVISTASVTADSPEIETYVAWWRKQSLAELTILHTRSRDEADRENFVEPLQRATGVWFMGGNQAWLIDTYSGTRTEMEMHKLLERGGVIGGTSAGAAVMSKLMIRRGGIQCELGRGFGFLDGAVVDQHFVRRQRTERLLNVIEQHPQLVGLGIDEGTALLVQGRKLSVLGESEVRVCFARTDTREPTVDSMRRGAEADLRVLGRIAAARRQPQGLIAAMKPQVLDGTLVIVGGNHVPAEATQRFVAAAGGKNATVTVVSLDGDDAEDGDNELMEHFRRAGAKAVQCVQVTSRKQADDPRIIASLKSAKGIWLRGDRPHKFVESCLGTVAEKICRDCLKDGGVIGGTAAGGLMHGEVLVNASPVAMKRVLVEGYDRGFGFLPGVAITSTSQPGDLPDEMTQLQREHPQVVGLGIGDSTAMIVRGHVMEVVGTNQVTVLSNHTGTDLATLSRLNAGDRYDFNDRSQLEAGK